MERVFSAADILLPDFEKTEGSRWSVIACDQFTSENEYWEETEKTVGDAPSALRLILPELYLGKNDGERIDAIHKAMDDYKKNVLKVHKDSMIYLRRTCPTGKVREGLIGKIDLEAYDYNKGATTPVRATEGTVLSRIPPRVKVRRGASLELPHVMLLVDDAENRLFSLLGEKRGERAYAFPLMQGGGAVEGFFVSNEVQEAALSVLDGLGGQDGLVFAVGDGNHSLASAKAYYEEIKASLGEEKAKNHPARYALAEIVNIHSEALVFEPIYRVVFGANKDDLLSEMKKFADAQSGDIPAQSVTVVYQEKSEECKEVFAFPVGAHTLTVGTLQIFLDEYIKKNEGVEVDYIHDESSLLSLASREGAVGFLFDGMKKEELFSAVAHDGALPRKTFSMGVAREKRYYLEAREISL